MPEEEDEDKEGLLSKLWRYFRYFSTGRTIYKNWEGISKLLGLEDLTKSIKSISEELGITKVIDNINLFVYFFRKTFTKKIHIITYLIF